MEKNVKLWLYLHVTVIERWTLNHHQSNLKVFSLALPMSWTSSHVGRRGSEAEVFTNSRQLSVVVPVKHLSGTDSYGWGRCRLHKVVGLLRHPKIKGDTVLSQMTLCHLSQQAAPAGGGCGASACVNILSIDRACFPNVLLVWQPQWMWSVMIVLLKVGWRRWRMSEDFL